MYTPDDMDQIFELVKAVWGQKLKIPERTQWIEGWKWLFVNNPAGNSIIWLAEHNHKIVGEYPLVMIDMKVGNRLAKAGQIADTMTHPQYRRQGIAFILGRESLSLLEEQKAMLAFGFPTTEAYPLHMNSGWIDVCSIQTLIKPLNLKNMVKGYLTHDDQLINTFSKFGDLLIKTIFRAKKPSVVDGLTISEIFHFDDRYNEFWERISKDYRIIAVRNKEYLNWRYIDAPNAKYTIYVAERNEMICGYMVLENKYCRGLPIGRILDIAAPLDQQIVIQCLISKAIEHFERKEADAIFSNIISNRYLHSFLKNGFLPYPISKNRFIAYNASPNIPDGYLKNPKNWFIQLGDLPMVF
jgi:GNAT superfamily N-acetyltransferase